MQHKGVKINTKEADEAIKNALISFNKKICKVDVTMKPSPHTPEGIYYHKSCLEDIMPGYTEDKNINGIDFIAKYYFMGDKNHNYGFDIGLVTDGIIAGFFFPFKGEKIEDGLNTSKRRFIDGCVRKETLEGYYHICWNEKEMKYKEPQLSDLFE